MKSILLSVVLMTILTGCGVEWFPDDSTTTPSVSITTATLPDAPTDFTYSQILTASGGTGTYTWELANSTLLPAGLSLNAGGTISGTPTVVTATTAGTAVYTFSVKVSDSATTPASATKSLSIFTPTTGRMFDPTGKVYAEGLTFATQILTLTVTNTDSIPHTVQVVVTDFDITGKEIAHSTFNMSPTTVTSGTPKIVTNPLTTPFSANNWRITNVIIQ